MSTQQKFGLMMMGLIAAMGWLDMAEAEKIPLDLFSRSLHTFACWFPITYWVVDRQSVSVKGQ